MFGNSPKSFVDRHMAVAYAMILVGIGMVIVAFLGEVLGWWNDFGPVLGGLGFLVSVIGLAVGVLLNANKNEVREVGRGVRHVGEGVRQVGEGVRHVGEDVRQVGQEVRGVGADVRAGNALLAQIVAILSELRDRSRS
jgi:hypothetical protein